MLMLCHTCWLDLQVRYKVLYIKQLVNNQEAELSTRAESSTGQCVKKKKKKKNRNTAGDVKIYEEVDFLCLVPGVWMCAVDAANNSPDKVCVFVPHDVWNLYTADPKTAFLIRQLT